MSNFVSIETEENKIKLKNFFLVSIYIGFAWMLFHFTIVFFFGLILGSAMLIGLFLGIGNLVSLILDIPVGVLQKYIKPKTFLMIAVGLMLLTSLIFIKFIYFQGDPNAGQSGGIIDYLGMFLNSSLNIILLIVGACLYGIIKESFDVTTLSYIFNISTPSEYASVISKYNIYNGIGSMIGLVFSGILLALNIKIAIIIFVIILLIFFGFLAKYFDNTKDSIEIGDIKSLKKIKLDSINLDLSKKGGEMISKINTKSLIELSRNTKIILLKPTEIKKNIDFKEVYKTTLTGFERFKNVILGIPLDLILIWIILVITQFGFWDTFVSTFQVEFLNKIIALNSNSLLISQTGGILTGYLLLGLLALPAFLLQDFFIDLSKKMGVYKVVIFGITVSAFSLMFFGLVDKIYFVILFGLLNSIGYAAAMPISQAVFGEVYNINYAKKFNLREIDSTISAAPLKIILNFANVIGLLVGGLLVGVLGFNGFFIVFSFLTFGLLIYSFLKMETLTKLYTEEGNNKENESGENKTIDKDFI